MALEIRLPFEFDCLLSVFVIPYFTVVAVALL